MIGSIEKQLIINKNSAINLEASIDFLDEKIKRKAGQRWQKQGPFIYTPKIEENVIEIINSTVK